jgi:CubicO group peptidase (beta-lactamase class C family)
VSPFDAINRTIVAAPYAHTTNVVVLERGEIVFERHYGNGSLDDLVDTYSVTKSVLATLVGIALRRGDLDTIDRTVASCIDRPIRHGYTLRHLLTMTAGVETDGAWEIDAVMARSDSWLDWLLAAPARDEPGIRFRYDNGSAHVLGCAVASIIGAALSEYARRHLFAPLGIERWEWPSDADGFDYGFGHLRLAPRDLAKVGELYRTGGGDVLSREFVSQATTAHSTGGPPENVGYGFLWWVDDGPPRSFFAGGYAGQSLTVVPAREVVAVTTGDERLLEPGWRNAREVLMAAAA